MPFEEPISKTLSSSDSNTKIKDQLHFGSSLDYADQKAALKNDDAFKESTYSFMLSQADNQICIPDDSEDSFEKFRVCVETGTLRKALESKDQKKIQTSCDEINSNYDGRAVHNRLTLEERKQVHLESRVTRGQINIFLLPGPSKKTN